MMPSRLAPRNRSRARAYPASVPKVSDTIVLRAATTVVLSAQRGNWVRSNRSAYWFRLGWKGQNGKTDGLLTSSCWSLIETTSMYQNGRRVNTRKKINGSHSENRRVTV